jgi:type II secretory pathway component GspD/PulD (secretin)
MTANEAGNSIVITDTQSNIRRVAEIIQAIELGAEDMTEVEVFKLLYADPTEMATLLTSVFPDESKSSGSQSPIQFGRGGFGGLFGGRGGPGGGGGNAGTGGGGDQNSRIKKRAKVIAVADARTQSVIVSAASGLMDQIRTMVTQLDSNPAKKQNVYVYSLENADAQQVESVLQEMFETTTRNNSRNSQNQNNALQNRANQSQQGTTTTGTGTRAGGNRTSGGLGTGGF